MHIIIVEDSVFTDSGRLKCVIKQVLSNNYQQDELHTIIFLLLICCITILLQHLLLNLLISNF